jgi:hypothetical protein
MERKLGMVLGASITVKWRAKEVLKDWSSSICIFAFVVWSSVPSFQDLASPRLLPARQSKNRMKQKKSKYYRMKQKKSKWEINFDGQISGINEKISTTKKISDSGAQTHNLKVKSLTLYQLS